MLASIRCFSTIDEGRPVNIVQRRCWSPSNRNGNTGKESKMRVLMPMLVGTFVALATIPPSTAIAAGSDADIHQESTPAAGPADDRLLILDLINRYGAVHDFGNPEEYADLFTANGEISVGNGPAIVKGHDALVAQAKSDHARFSGAPGTDGKTSSIMRHLISNAQVTLTGSDSAVGQTYVTTIVQKGDIGPTILSVGRYEDRFLKQNGQWRIAHRRIIIDFGNNELGKKLGFTK